jgi:lysine 6-dehydrogenase
LVLADYDRELAGLACDSVNSRLGESACEPASVDASDTNGLKEFLSRFDLAIAAAPYRLNPNISNAGIDVGCSVVDMGVDTPDALRLHSRSDEVAGKNVRIVTDCGVAPGLVNVLAYKLLEEAPDTDSVSLFCGGLPESASPPFFHKVGFRVDSLLGEYVDEVDSLRDGVVVRSDALTDFEEVDFPGVGKLEAVTTSGGTGTAPYDVQGRVKNYEYKTLRFPGHWQAMILLRDAGFWSEVPLPGGQTPRALTLAIMEQTMVEPDDRDSVVARVLARGQSGTRGYDLTDRFDPVTGFTAMQRTTGFSTSVVALEVLSGAVKPGCWSCERAVDPSRFLSEIARRGVSVTPAISQV